eukprot:TRINITY_DN20527_c0_g1_i7.p2 TRINITY_DN20527_c0_g1~~TRINITY_DN20527_c0_g1_i7.p2  ORF type:complete len:196 (-),score=50.37 TRINITY_DN20527_c0_g1_i7:85-585(-)
MLRSLVGSEMCIRDRSQGDRVSDITGVPGSSSQPLVSRVPVSLLPEDCTSITQHVSIQPIQHPAYPSSSTILSSIGVSGRCLRRGPLSVSGQPGGVQSCGYAAVATPVATAAAASSPLLIDWTLRHPVLCVDTCLLYTSDAADEEDSVDLGGRRIIKKKKKIQKKN